MFSDEDRRIFRYSYRGEEIALDPMVVARKFVREMPDAEAFDALLDTAFRDLAEVDAGVRDRMFVDLVIPAQEELARMTRAVFGYEAVRPDGTGMTEAEAIRLLDDWLAWESGLKKGGPDSSDAPPTTAGPANP